MIGATRKWIVWQLSLGEFSCRSDVVRYALWMSLKIAAFAYGLNLAAHFALYASGLLPYDLFDALVIATLLTPPVSFIVSIAAYLVVGFAIFDLAVSRVELERLSRTDMLSGLLNRRAFLDVYERHSAGVSLVLFDIDRFKSINDARGHTAGDDVIVSVARSLLAAFPEPFTCARIGGEEFAVQCGGDVPGLFERTEAARKAIASQFVETGQGTVRVSVSAGIANYSSGRDFAAVFAEADRALYRAKTDGRNRTVTYAQIESPRVARMGGDTACG